MKTDILVYWSDLGLMTFIGIVIIHEKKILSDTILIVLDESVVVILNYAFKFVDFL